MSRTLILFPVENIRKVKNSSIIVVLAWKYYSIQVLRVRISNRMAVGVPPSKAEIQATHEAYHVVNYDELFVVCPVQYYVICYTVNSLDGGMGCFGEVKMGEIFESFPKL